ncbi:Trypsin [Aliiroseovarius halocynthiae]|uniref:S1 family peptidase n=1 Tax=Aliiroseovarius halocynthiae TaxID=985055 RepID=A0A545SUB2_9RHOB|nr:trypsin-like serine protease [Aliiroseovarius halocynthiae]TQV68534.1 S1 family peptidase [Aliiroseovarius halocynthiae]SMR70938.1 Trypsin [Aliiroseovarius halocynthiae]
MRYLLAILVAALLLTRPLGASDPSPLRTLMTGDESKGWEAVGRLNIGGGSFCTGALIGENLVLTAAHCLFDRDSGERFKLSEIEFLAGWRGGRASAYRGVRRAVVHPDYAYTPSKQSPNVAKDLALLELEKPIRNSSIIPFQTFSRPRKGDEVGVVSYAHDRTESPALQKTCKVLARQSGVLVLNCTVDFGSSGAPVFVVEGGEPRIVSVISAKAMVRDIPVSLGTDLETPLAEMYEMLAAGDGVFTRVETVQEPKVRKFGTGAAGPGGAKFMRP